MPKGQWYDYHAKYVAEELTKRLKVTDLRVLAVTGESSEEQRESQIAELERSPRRLLVATDCLSEGINLQQAFDAVVHYDLPWNPNRLEQREGRVDRYGQPNTTVRTVLLYGQDNPIDEAVMKVINSGQYIMGPEVGQLEADLSAFCGAKHTLSCANGTDALVLALHALGVKEGDEVIVPAFTFFATAEAVALLSSVVAPEVIEALRAEGVPGIVGSYQNLHLLPMFKHKVAYGTGGFLDRRLVAARRIPEGESRAFKSSRA